MVTDTDKGYAKVIRAIEASSAPKAITVGIQADAPPDVQEYAAYNEFGTERIPARPFVAGWFDENQSKAYAKIKKACQTAISGGNSIATVLDQLAQSFAGGMQSRISQGIAPPNNSNTIRQKGSSTPLIDHGLLRASIAGKVE